MTPFRDSCQPVILCLCSFVFSDFNESNEAPELNKIVIHIRIVSNPCFARACTTTLSVDPWMATKPAPEESPDRRA